MATIVHDSIARASAILLPAGAYDVTPIEIPNDNFTEIMFMIQYTRGGVAGAVTFKVEMSNDRINWYQVAEFSSGTTAAGVDTQDKTQRAEITYQATSGSAEGFTSPTFEISSSWIRINFKESGAVGTPGTVFCEYNMKGAN